MFTDKNITDKNITEENITEENKKELAEISERFKEMVKRTQDPKNKFEVYAKAASQKVRELSLTQDMQDKLIAKVNAEDTKSIFGVGYSYGALNALEQVMDFFHREFGTPSVELKEAPHLKPEVFNNFLNS